MTGLTKEQYTILANRIIEEHRKYAEKLSPGEWAQIAARKVVGHIQDFREGEESFEKLPQWIPVSERMPEPSKRVLVLVRRIGLKGAPGELEQHVGYKMHNGRTWVVGNYFSYDIGEPISWRELDPDPPIPQPPNLTSA